MNILCWLIKELIYDSLLFPEYKFNIFQQRSFYGVHWVRATAEGPEVVRYIPCPSDTWLRRETCPICKCCLSICTEAMILLFWVLSFANICRVYLLISSLLRKSSAKINEFKRYFCYVYFCVPEDFALILGMCLNNIKWQFILEILLCWKSWFPWIRFGRILWPFPLHL